MVRISLGRMVDYKMSQTRTFSKLKQKVSHTEMLEIWKSFQPSIAPVYQICMQTFERKVDYLDTTFLYEKTKVLEEYGWTLEELAAESERKAVRKAVDMIN